MGSLIQATYPAGRFLAIFGGTIIAAGASFKELNETLHHLGNHSRDVLIVQTGVEYPQSVTNFAVDFCP